MVTATNPLEKCTACSHPRRQHRITCACGCPVMQVAAPAPGPRHAKPKAKATREACPECGRKRGHKLDCTRSA